MIPGIVIGSEFCVACWAIRRITGAYLKSWVFEKDFSLLWLCQKKWVGILVRKWYGDKSLRNLMRGKGTLLGKHFFTLQAEIRTVPFFPTPPRC